MTPADREGLGEIQRRLDRLSASGEDTADLAGALRRLRDAHLNLRILGCALRNAVVARLGDDEHSGDVARWDAEVGQ